jgi:hypothetical protein
VLGAALPKLIGVTSLHRPCGQSDENRALRRPRRRLDATNAGSRVSTASRRRSTH